MHLERYENIAKKIQDVLSKQIFFVVGSPKSGTTWLQKLLDSHPDILCSGEGHFHRFFNDFGQVIKKYNTGKEDVSKFVYEGKPYYSPVDNEQFDFLMTSFICSMLGQRNTAEGIQFLGDKTPLHVEFMETLRIIFPAAKFIHIIRDGRDVAISLTRHSDRMLNRAPTNAGDDLFYQCIKESAQRWNNAIQAALRFKQKFPQNYHEVRYWELKQKPVEAMAGILNFLGAPYTLETIQQMYDAASFKKLSGGRKAGEEDNSSFFRKGIIGDWKNHFDAKSLEIFNQHAASSLVATGYDVVTHEPAA